MSQPNRETDLTDVASAGHRRRAWLRFGIGLALAIVVIGGFWRWFEPVREYRGRPVEAWVMDLRQPDPATRSNALAVLQGAGPGVVPTLTGLLQRQDSFWARPVVLVAPHLPGRLRMWTVTRFKPSSAVEYRLGAAEALGYFGNHAPVTALGDALRDSRLEVGHMAARSLGRVGRDGVLVLAGALTDPDVGMRTLACYGLNQARAGAIDAAPGLIQHLADPDDDVRRQVAQILNRLGRPAVPALVEALKDPEPSIRLAAVTALGNLGIGARAASPALSALADRDPDGLVRRRAKEVLPRVGSVPASARLESTKPLPPGEHTPQ